MRRFLAVLSSALLISGGAYALDRPSVIGVQIALGDHGFNPGDPDGAIGPATRSAIKGFAKKYSVEETPDAVLNFMVEM